MLKQEHHAHPSKSKTFHEHFDKKWPQTMEGEAGKSTSLDEVVRMGGTRVLYYAEQITASSSHELTVTYHYQFKPLADSDVEPIGITIACVLSWQ
jgi:hypothetical protein